MARIGEKIGDAYVRIHADGSNISDEVRDDFRNLEPVLRDLGEDHSEDYAKGWKRGLKRNRLVTGEDIARGLDATSGQLDARMSRITKILRKSMQKELGDHFGDEVGLRMARSLERELISGRLTSQQLAALFPSPGEIDKTAKRMRKQLLKEQEALLKDFEGGQKKRAALLREAGLREIDIQRKVAALRKRLEEEQQRRAERGASLLARLREQALKDIEKDEREHQKRMERARKEGLDTELNMQRIAEDFRRRQAAERDEEFDRHHRRLAQLDSDYHSLIDTVKKFSAGQADATVTSRDLRREVDRIRTTMRDLDVNTRQTDDELRRLDRRIRRATPTIDKFGHQWDRLNDRIGRVFGRGSRNNFLNFVGSFIRGSLRLQSALVLGLVKVFPRVIRGFSDMIDGVRKFAQVVSEEGLRAGLQQLGAALLGLSSTLATGGLSLIAGLAALAVVLTTVSVSAGILAAALSGLVAILTALVGTITFGLLGALSAVAGALVPLAAGISVVVAGFKSLSDEQKEALKADIKPLTNAFKDLGKAAADVLFQDVGKWAKQLAPRVKLAEDGVRGVARAIREVLGKAIEDASTNPKFEHFVERLNVFLPNAVRKLSTALTNTFAGLGGVFLAMLPLVNRFLRWLVDITGEFAKWANSAGGRKELREFFDQAGDSAAALGDFLAAATKALGTLLGKAAGTGDNIFRDLADKAREFSDWLSKPENQQAIEDWLAFGRDLAEAIGRATMAVIDLIDALDTPASRKALIILIDLFSDLLDIIGKLFSAWSSGLESIVRGASTATTAWNGFKSVIDGIAGIFGGGGDSFFGDFVAQAAGAADASTRLAKKIQSLDVLNNIAPGATDRLQALRESLDQVTGAATKTTFALVRQQLQEAGLTDVARQLGLSQQTLVQAFSGNKNAALDLVNQFQNLKGVTGEQIAAFNNLLFQMGFNIRNLRAERGEILANSRAMTNYTNKLKGVPEKVKSLIIAEGITPTIKGIARVVAKAKELAPGLKPRQIKTIITATGADFTKEQIEKIINLAEKYGKQKPTAKADLDAQAAELSNRRIVEKLKDYGATKVTATADLNTDPARAEMDRLTAYLSSRPDIYQDVFIRTHRVDVGGGGGTSTGTTPGGREPESTASGKVIAPTINVTTVTADPWAVAQETLNRFVALGY